MAKIRAKRKDNKFNYTQFRACRVGDCFLSSN